MGMACAHQHGFKLVHLSMFFSCEPGIIQQSGWVKLWSTHHLIHQDGWFPMHPRLTFSAPFTQNLHSFLEKCIAWCHFVWSPCKLSAKVKRAVCAVLLSVHVLRSHLPRLQRRSRGRHVQQWLCHSLPRFLTCQNGLSMKMHEIYEMKWIEMNWNNSFLIHCNRWPALACPDT